MTGKNQKKNPEKNSVALTRSIQEDVVQKIKLLESEGSLVFPKNYCVSNAMKSAFLNLQEVVNKNNVPALECCTKISIANAILKMVIQGLSVAKNQVYFIVRGDKLCCDRSYFGTVSVVKRIKGVVDCHAQVVYEGDEFEFEIQQARKVITKHKQTLESIQNGKIVACYSTLVYVDNLGQEKEYSEVMTMEQVETAWEKSPSREKAVHKKFPEEMAKRTVLNRGCKVKINTSDDEDLETIIGAFNRTDGREEFDLKSEEANSGEIIDAQDFCDKEPESETEPESERVVEPVSETMEDPEDIEFAGGKERP